jgi:hypothetical protein
MSDDRDRRIPIIGAVVEIDGIVQFGVIGYEPCRWFALCPNDATQTVPHPILGDVPACDRCADRARS